MFKMRALLLLGSLAAISEGCAWTNANSIEAQRTAQADADRIDGERRAQEMCRSVERDKTASVERVRECRRERYRRSGVVCQDDRLSERVVQIKCTAPLVSGDVDHDTMNERALLLASYAAISAGRTHFVTYQEPKAAGQYSYSTTPVSCQEKQSALRAIAVGFSAIGNGTHSETTCDRLGVTATCDTRTYSPPPLPPAEIECTGGDQRSKLVGFELTSVFELLGEQEAKERDVARLPIERRPVQATEIIKYFRVDE